MRLKRVLEPEVMDSDEEALAYDSMDHSVVNHAFVDDLLALGPLAGDILDLGTGTARIPIELCQHREDVRVMAVDAARSMLEIARFNLEFAGLTERIQLALVDAKNLPFADHSFAAVISNSILHHIPEPCDVLREAVRTVVSGGRLFFRDLMRPADDDSVKKLVDQYAGECEARQRELFEASLRAAFELDEIRALVAQLGFPAESVHATSDRHWTWSTLAR